MDELNLIKKLESLKEIKPNNDWVVFTKREVLSKQFEKEEILFSFESLINKIAYVFETPKVLAPVLSGLIVAVFGFAIITAQGTNPGDNLYSIKKTCDQMKMSFMTPEEQTVARVKQVDQILVQLDKISKAGENKNRKLEASIVNEAREALTVVSKLSEDKKVELAQRVISGVSKFEGTSNASLISDDNEDYQTLRDIYKLSVEGEIKNLESNENNLNEKQLSLLEIAKENFLIGNYLEAMETIYQIQPKEVEEEESGEEEVKE
jgi:hypothetical protein